MNRPIRMLYVDENVADRAAVKAVLERRPTEFLVIEEPSWKEAIERRAQESFDLVLTAEENRASGEAFSADPSRGQIPMILLARPGQAAEARVGGDADRNVLGAEVARAPESLRLLPHVISDLARMSRGPDGAGSEAGEAVDLESDLIETRKRLEAAEKEIESFAYSVSHDLRAPLRAIEGFSKILLEDYLEGLDEEAQRYLQIVTSSAERMQGMIDDLLQYSRLTRTPMNIVELDMDALASEAIAEVQKTEPERSVKVSVSSLPPASGDPTLIRTVWRALASNAFKFTRSKEGAEIWIEGREAEDEVIYSVRDNGVGFDMEYASKLFTVFQKLHQSEETEGSGIGLAIVQRILHRHRGKAWAEAKTDAGATFYFSLPGAKFSRENSGS